MTQQQIAYLKNLEEKRHNEVTEKETQRHNTADEQIRADSAKAQLLSADVAKDKLDIDQQNADTAKEQAKASKTSALGSLFRGLGAGAVTGALISKLGSWLSQTSSIPSAGKTFPAMPNEFVQAGIAVDFALADNAKKAKAELEKVTAEVQELAKAHPEAYQRALDWFNQNPVKTDSLSDPSKPMRYLRNRIKREVAKQSNAEAGRTPEWAKEWARDTGRKITSKIKSLKKGNNNHEE